MNGKVCKFGGSSLADGNALQRVTRVVEEDGDRRFIVVSAPGKRFAADEKVTDLLYRCHAHAQKAQKTAFDADFLRIRERFESFKKVLPPSFVDRETERVKKSVFQARSADFAASRGEYLTAKFVAKALDMPFVDATDCVFLEGNMPSPAGYEAGGKRLKKENGAVVPGFYGRDGQGRVKTFSRGGGDVSGAVLARALRADAYENFTDVNGFFAVNPAFVKNPVKIPVLSFAELRVLAKNGVSVLHGDVAIPLSDTDIPVYVKNTFDPHGAYTLVKRRVALGERLTLAGVAGKRLHGGKLALIAAVGENGETARRSWLCSFGAEPVFTADKTAASYAVVEAAGFEACVRATYRALFEI